MVGSYDLLDICNVLIFAHGLGQRPRTWLDPIRDRDSDKSRLTSKWLPSPATYAKFTVFASSTSSMRRDSDISLIMSIEISSQPGEVSGLIF